MMHEDWEDRLDGFDAIYCGAVGWPETVPGHVSLPVLACRFVPWSPSPFP